MPPDQVRDGHMIHDPVHRIRQLPPDAGRLAEGLPAAAAVLSAFLQTGSGINALRQAQDLSHRIVFGASGKTVASLGASDAADKTRPVQDRYDLFQIFFRYPLALCDLPCLHILFPAVQRQIQHDADRISAFGGNSHGTHSVFLNYGNYSS